MELVVPIVVTFLAILALISLATAIVLIVAPRRWIVPQIGPVAANLAWAVAVVSTLGSLFLSEVANFIPCLLCWIQRGFMYPLAIALAFPRARRSWAVCLWALAGSLVSIYHYAIEQIPSFAGSDFCSATIPCSFIWVEEFGFVTIPFMALCGFLSIAAITLTHRRWLRAMPG
jgi:disulfide bond formation protein DsbB